VVFGVALSAATGLACGLLPAWQATRTGAEQALRNGLIPSKASHLRLRNLLVAFQMSLALVLLAGAGLMLRSFAARLATSWRKNDRCDPCLEKWAGSRKLRGRTDSWPSS
jgi:hypothetical protein